ncbi:NLR family CARD domain-containing protein 4-like [Amphiura filiformis]|uniref:NLR family CARD domain-containing protein 4-like n=1 Tax=Amphiura filiformis TaxID=82378 RepID=UPI003B22221A
MFKFYSKPILLSSGNTHYAFDLNICKQELHTSYQHTLSKVQLLPWCDDETKEIADIYVNLELEETANSGTSVLDNNEDLASLQTSEGIPATRVLVKGLAGSGKSTLLTRLAYSWSKQKNDVGKTVKSTYLTLDVVSLLIALIGISLEIWLRLGLGLGLVVCAIGMFAYSNLKQKGKVPLAKFELVFIICLRELQKGCNLIDAIFEQILADDTKVPKKGLRSYIESNPNKVLILLDGFDEYVDKNLSGEENGIERIIMFQELRECPVILTTRPYESLGRYQSYYISVKLTGFSPANVRLYITKFFSGQTEIAEELDNFYKRLQESELLNSLSTIPVILMLLCLLWEDDQTLPQTQSQLYQNFALFLWRRHCVRYGKQRMSMEILSSQNENDDDYEGDNDRDSNDKYSDNDDSDKVEKVMPKHPMYQFTEFLQVLGSVALTGLFPKKNIQKEQLTFHDKDFDASLFQIGCQMGILTKERLRSKLNTRSTVTFLHKSFQEYCAATYLTSLFDKDKDQFYGVLKRINTWGLFLSKIELIKFCCGCANNAGFESILENVIQLFTMGKGPNKASKIQIGYSLNNEFDITAILTLLYESQCKDDDLTRTIQPLLSVETLEIRNYHPQTLPILHHFVKTPLGLSTLHCIKTVDFDDHPIDSLDVIPDTISCMPSIRTVRIETKQNYGDRSVANKTVVDKLGKQLAASSEMFKIELRAPADIDNLLRHLSSSPHAHKYGAITFSKVTFTSTNMVKLLSNLKNLKNLYLRDIDASANDTASLFDAIQSSINELSFIHINVASAVSHIGHIMTPHLHMLILRSVCLKEAHIEILSRFLPKAFNLQALILSTNTIRMAIVSLAKQLQYCTKLNDLRFIDSQITDSGVCELAQRFHHLPDLSRFDISMNHLGNSALDAVFKHMHHLPKLRRLDISVTVDNQCTPLVKDCLAVIGEIVPQKASKLEILIIDTDDVQSICYAASKYV